MIKLIIELMVFILFIILLVKIWQMTNDVRIIRDTYLKSIDRNNCVEKESKELNDGFGNEDLVILKASGKQMRIKEYNKDLNKFECYTNNFTCYEGAFSASELEHKL